ncbi:MAG: hypothetical protein FJY67_10430 [Calditrichaeota bacterium]|nr:hypothetical protein [Calditrichota bacterium]
MLAVVFFWVGVNLLGIYLSILLVTRSKPTDWAGVLFIALAMPLVETSRFWLLFFTNSPSVMLWTRLAAALVAMLLLFAYAHLMLGLERVKEKLLIACAYPGLKFLGYATISLLQQ